MRLPLIVAMLVSACVVTAGAGAPRAAANQASSSATTAKPAVHKKKHHASSKRQPSQKAPSPDRISEIQSALGRGGYYHGEPNGRWDANTVGAVEKFQSANGMEANGKLDAPTLQKLGLGSDIAGVSAPKPAAPPACCSMAPAAAPPSTQTAASSSSAVAENSAATSVGKPAEH